MTRVPSCEEEFDARRDRAREELAELKRIAAEGRRESLEDDGWSKDTVRGRGTMEGVIEAYEQAQERWGDKHSHSSNGGRIHRDEPTFSAWHQSGPPSWTETAHHRDPRGGNSGGS